MNRSPLLASIYPWLLAWAHVVGAATKLTLVVVDVVVTVVVSVAVDVIVSVAVITTVSIPVTVFVTGTSVAIDTVTVDVVVSGVSIHEQNTEAIDGVAVMKLDRRSPELVMVALDISAELIMLELNADDAVA